MKVLIFGCNGQLGRCLIDNYTVQIMKSSLAEEIW